MEDDIIVQQLFILPPPWEEVTPLPTGAGLGYVTRSGMENVCRSVQCTVLSPGLEGPVHFCLRHILCHHHERTGLQEAPEDERHMSRPQLSMWPGQTSRPAHTSEK